MTQAQAIGGLLRGEADAKGIVSFKGVPYAASPVGVRRFAAPEPHPGWDDTLDATRYGPIAPQHLGLLGLMFGSTPPVQSEDCLTLNVFTPGVDHGHRPVMVWIHGGAYLTGSANTEWYDGGPFAACGDVVVVTINYRLGALGFTHLGDIGGERFASSGNLGLLDQVAALQWVRYNIAGFGGDPANVTIFGESAGGGSVLSLLCMPAADSLVHRAISQSPSFSQFRSRARANEAAQLLLDQLETANPNDLIELPLEHVMAAQQVLESPASGVDVFAPTPDGTVLDDHVTDMLVTGRHAPVPLLIGTNADEMRMFTAFDPANAAMGRAETVRYAGEALADAYRAAHPHDSWGQVASAVATERTFRIPAIRTAEVWPAPTWMYRFDWRSPALGGVLGACHALELPFVFGRLDAPGVEFITGNGADRANLSETMHGDWLTFVRTGRAPWPEYEPVRRTTRIYGNDTDLVDDPDRDLRRLWP